MRPRAWFAEPAFLLEVFLLFNMAVLAVDIYLAHSINAFAHPAEWIPVVFSAGGTVALIAAFPRRPDLLTRGVPRGIGMAVGALSCAVGVAGMLFHLNSQFFELFTIKSLVYTAPFAAPLAYTGVGLLLLLDRMVPVESEEWAMWVVILAWGAFAGNFVLALADHAQNGFFVVLEWLPVASSAAALGFLFVVMLGERRRGFLALCGAVMGAQVVVGLLGFYFHIAADLAGPARSQSDDFIYGAPLFAPLLLPNAAMLGGLALWSLSREGVEGIDAAPSPAG